MLDFNDVSIKSSEDLRDALLTEMSPESFLTQFDGMVKRWGLKDSLSMLASALCGNEEFEGALKFTHEIVDRFPESGDPNDYSRESKKK